MESKYGFQIDVPHELSVDEKARIAKILEQNEREGEARYSEDVAKIDLLNDILADFKSAKNLTEGHVLNEFTQSERGLTNDIELVIRSIFHNGFEFKYYSGITVDIDYPQLGSSLQTRISGIVHGQLVPVLKAHLKRFTFLDRDAGPLEKARIEEEVRIHEQFEHDWANGSQTEPYHGVG